MAEIQVDVTLPSATSVDVTSPTQALAANVVIPGPQGPRGAPTSINGLSNENIYLSGVDGVRIFNSGVNTIFISGSGNYFISSINNLTTNLNLTGSNLQTQIDNLDLNYATDAQLQNTGTTLVNSINSLSGTLTGNYYLKSNPSGFITGVDLSSYLTSSTASATYATIINLGSTGLNLQNQIDNLGNTYATDTELSTVQTNLNNKITSLSGDAVLLKGNQIIQGQKTFTGSNVLIEKELYVYGSGYFPSGIKIGTDSVIINGNKVLVNNDPVALTSELNQTGATLINNVTSLSGSSILAYGEQTIGGIKIFSGSNVALNVISGASLTVSGNPVLTGVDLSSYATNANLAQTGSSLQNQINNLDNTYATDSALASTGSTLVQSINSLSTTLTNDYYLKSNPSGFITGVDLSSYLTTSNASITYATISNLALTGSSLQNQINNLDNTYATDINLASTGSSLQNQINNLGNTYATDSELSTVQTNLDNKINSLSGSSVLLYGDQSIGGIKTFRDNVYINNLFVTGTETIVNTPQINIASNYLLLNLTGGAVDGGIFFVTGSGLTGINDIGPIIGFDHTDKFKFGISSRGADLSTLNDIASVQQIQAYSGFVDGKYATIINLASTGSTLQTQINNLGTTYATVTNLASTGSALDSKINSLSGTLTSDYATVANLASTGSALDNKVNILSGFSVLTFGNQLINGTKTFDSGVVINVQPTNTNPALNITGTWNNASEIYTGIHLDITDTNSNSTSTFLNLRTNGISRLRIRKDGAIFGRDAGFGSDDGFSFGDQAGGAISCYSASLETLRISRNVNPAPGIVFTRSLGGMTFSEGHALYSQGANIIGQSNGSNPQSLRIFNATGTNSGEFGIFGWQNNQLRIGSQATSSGISRDVLLTGNNVLISGNNFNIAQNGQINILPAQDLTHNFAPASNTAFLQAGALRLNASATTLSLRRAGTDLLTLNNSNEIQLASTSPLQWNNDTYLYRDAANTLAQRSAANAQQFRVYNSTGTNSGEFALFGWQNNNLIIGSQATNSGILRPLVITGDSISYSGKILTIAHANAGFFMDATGPTIRGNHWGAGDAGFIKYRNGLDLGRGGSTYLKVDSSTPVVVVGRGTNTAGVVGVGFDGTNSALSSPDAFIIRDGAGILSLRNPITNDSPQQLRIFNISGTNTGEFGVFGWINSGLVIGPQQTNSGILRNIVITGSNINLSSTGNITIDRNSQIIFPSKFGTTSFPNRLYTDSPTDTNNNYYFYGGNGGGNFVFNSQDGNWNLVLGTAGAIGFAQQSNQQKGSFSPDVLLYRDAANTLALRNGTSSQRFRVYNATGTNSGEFALFGWQNNNLIIGAQQSQSGILRDMTLTGRNININASGVFNIFDTTNISGNLNLTGNLAVVGNRPTVNGTGILLSGEAASLPTTIVYTTGDQTIGGNKTFTGTTTFSGQEVNLVDIALNLSGVGDMTFVGTNINFINSPVFISGTNLRVTGDILANNAYITGNVGVGTNTPSEKLEVNGNIKFNKFIMWDAPNALYNTGRWEDSELILTNTWNNRIFGIRMDGSENWIYSQNTTIKLPSGKNDFIAMDAEVVHRTGVEIISGVKTFIGNHIISGNTTISGSINISGNYDVFSQIENVKKLAIAYAIAL